MSISITAGKARIFPITATLSDGNPDNTTGASVVSNAPSANLVCKINPTNPRELGVRAVAAGQTYSVQVSVGTVQAAAIQVQPVAPTLVSVTVGTDGGEVDPPSWL